MGGLDISPKTICITACGCRALSCRRSATSAARTCTRRYSCCLPCRNSCRRIWCRSVRRINESWEVMQSMMNPHSIKLRCFNSLQHNELSRLYHMPVLPSYFVQHHPNLEQMILAGIVRSKPLQEIKYVYAFLLGHCFPPAFFYHFSLPCGSLEANSIFIRRTWHSLFKSHWINWWPLNPAANKAKRGFAPYIRYDGKQLLHAAGRNSAGGLFPAGMPLSVRVSDLRRRACRLWGIVGRALPALPFGD